MDYADFSARDLQTRFNLSFKATYLWKEVEEIVPSDWLKSALNKAEAVGFSSEKSRSERLVTPILLEMSELNKHIFTIYSGENLVADEKKGLNGECDFLLSFGKIIAFITAPIFCITEAKKQDIEKGLIQCAAQLLGAKIFNEQEGRKVDVLYGCSTTGIEWWFLKLENDTITIDRNRYYIQELPQLLGILQNIIKESEKYAPTT